MKRMLSAVLAMLMLFAVGSSMAVNIDLGTPRDESEGYSYFTSLAVEGNNVWVMRNGDAGQALVCYPCLLYTSPSPRDKRQSRMPSSA